MKKIFLLLIMASSLFATALDSIALIKGNYRNYYFGEGISYNPTEANNYAVNDLISQIAVNVSSDFTRIVDNQDINQVELIMKQQASASLQNLNTISFEREDGNFHIFKYIERSQVDSIFEARKELIYDIYTQATTSIDNGDLGNALKLLYFSNILMNSLPGERIEYGNINFSVAIPSLINDILTNIQFHYTNRVSYLGNSTDITIKASYKGREVNNLEFYYWDGVGNRRIRLRDGFSVITLTGNENQLTNLRVFVEYQYEANRNEFRAVNDLWNTVKRPRFDNRKNISLTEPKEIESQNFKVASSTEEAISNEGRINTAIFDFMNKLNNKTFDYEDQRLNEKLNNLLRYTSIELVSADTEGRIQKTYEGYEYRPLYVRTTYDSINLSATEALVLDFDEDGNLIDVNFSMKRDLYNGFVSSAKEEDDWLERQVIAKFLEKYRTCFLSRDIRTLESIFSDDAIIIVGHIQKANNDRNYEFIEEDKYIQIRHTKEEYIRNTRRMFRNREDIFLDFNSIRLDKRNDLEGVYGLSMRQNFSSTTYSDEGHLFLLVDFNNDKPQIHIRSWQPEEWDSYAIHSLSDFFLFK